MAQYIPKAAVLAEIERRLEVLANTSAGDNKEFAAIIGAQHYELINLVQYINTLEVKEVDLKKEVEDFKEKIIKSSKAYRAYREECGIKDPILLDEVEEAYYAAYEQCYKDNVKSHREYYQKLDCGKWQTKTK